ncbi:MAG TPA: Rnase Y domain-containing protein, partial [Candidatus Dormibacteraeota bacterium]
MTVVIVLAAALLGVAAVITLRARALGGRPLTRDRTQAEQRARAALEDARSAARVLVERARLEVVQQREAALDEVRAREAALEAADRRLAAKHFELTDARTATDERKAALEERQAALEGAREDLRGAATGLDARLQASASMTRDDAAGQVLARTEGELAADHPGRVERALRSRIGELDPAANALLVTAIQRQDAANVDGAPRGAPLPLESLADPARERLLNALAVVAEDTFTDLGVDEERQQATLRGLDPIGREVARQASIEVLDRRLSAEEVPPLLVRTRTEVRRAIADLGERTLWEMGIEGRPEIAELLGTLHYRFSYGQNALLHCRETGDLCAALAAELGLDAAESRRAGLFHDIGKAVDHDVEGSHA